MNVLKRLRLDKEMTLRDLSDKTNIDYSTIAKIEKGERNFTEQTLVILADFFNVSTDYLLGRTDIQKPEVKIIEKFIPSQSKSPLANTPEYQTVTNLVDRLERDELIMLKGMIMAIIGSERKDAKSERKLSI